MVYKEFNFWENASRRTEIQNNNFIVIGVYTGCQKKKGGTADFQYLAS